MKKPWVAFLLSLLLPGSGLAYLGKWLWAILNFAIVQAVLLSVVLWGSDKPMLEHFHYIMLGLAAGSAGIAHALAMQTNARRQLADHRNVET